MSNEALRLDGVEVRDEAELVRVYRSRVSRFGLSGRTMFYATEEQYHAKIAQFSVLLHSAVAEQDSVLDIGCGYGSLVPVLPPCHYLGIDLVPEFVDHAKQRYSRLDFRVSSLDNWTEKVDWAVLMGVLNGIPQPKQILQRAWSCCNKGLIVDFIEDKKLRGGLVFESRLNTFDIGQCVNDFTDLGAKKVDVFPTEFSWTILMVRKQGSWIEWR